MYPYSIDVVLMFQSPPTSAASAHIARVALARFTPQLRRAHSHCLALRQEYVSVCTATRTELQSCAEFNSQTLREVCSALQHAQTQRQQRWTRTLQREQRLMDFAQREHELRTGLLRTAFIAPYTSCAPILFWFFIFLANVTMQRHVWPASDTHRLYHSCFSILCSFSFSFQTFDFLVS